MLLAHEPFLSAEEVRERFRVREQLQGLLDLLQAPEAIQGEQGHQLRACLVAILEDAVIEIVLAILEERRR